MEVKKGQAPGYLWLSWILRILLILIAIYIETFSLEAFKSGFPLPKALLAFVLHSLPSIALVFILFIALKWEHIAGFTLMFFALMGTLPAGPPTENNLSFYIILASIALIGILFVANYFVLGTRRTDESF